MTITVSDSATNFFYGLGATINDPTPPRSSAGGDRAGQLLTETVISNSNNNCN